MQENHPLFANTQTVIVVQLLRGDITMIARVDSIALVIIFTLALLAGCTQSENIEQPKPPAEKLVVYSSHPLSILRPLLTRFEGETGIPVEVVRGGSGELMDRLEAEKDAPVCAAPSTLGRSFSRTTSARMTRTCSRISARRRQAPPCSRICLRCSW